MAKKITEFIDEHNHAEAPVQTFIPLDLREQVLKQMKLDKRAGIKVTWKTLIESACRAYLAERHQKAAVAK